MVMDTEMFNAAKFRDRHEIGTKNEYVLHIKGIKETHPHIATVLSDNTCTIYYLHSSLRKSNVLALDVHKNQLVDCNFSSDDTNLFYTCYTDSIKLWDIRTPNKSAITFKDDTVKDDKGKTKELSSFDISPNNRLLSAGTLPFDGDAFILFWDLRKSNLLGAYWESHTEEITQVKFHPTDSNKLMSGSTDCLINLYDLTQTTEDDALTDTFNTGCSIEKLQWFTANKRDKISCITMTTELQLWDIDGAAPYKHLTRRDVDKLVQIIGDSYIYLTDTHETRNGLMLLAGSNNCFNSFKINDTNCVPRNSFSENQQVVRCSWYNENNGILLTGGEKGMLDIWKLDDTLQ